MTERISYKQARSLLKPKKRSKFNNTVLVKDGVRWHSKKEYARWLTLLAMQEAGEISDLKRQVPFPLTVNEVRIATYNADFVYLVNGVVCVEDVKATRRPGQKLSATSTATYRRNKKHLKAEYGLDILET